MVTGRLSGSVLASVSDAGTCSAFNGNILARDKQTRLKRHHTARACSKKRAQSSASEHAGLPSRHYSAIEKYRTDR
jgi:hypothetical protein